MRTQARILEKRIFAAAKGLIEVSGGLDALQGNLNTYYANFYSAEEQRAQTIKNINATVGNGFDAAATDTEEFRAIVEAAMLDTSESGLMLTAKLLSVAGAFASMTDAVNDAWASMSDSMIAEIRQKLKAKRE